MILEFSYWNLTQIRLQYRIDAMTSLSPSAHSSGGPFQVRKNHRISWILTRSARIYYDSCEERTPTTLNDVITWILTVLFPGKSAFCSLDSILSFDPLPFDRCDQNLSNTIDTMIIFWRKCWMLETLLEMFLSKTLLRTGWFIAGFW